jgi:hypothetical protein
MPLTVIPQQPQSGTIKSGAVSVPNGAARINVSAVMSEADVITPGNTVDLQISMSLDGVSYGHACSCRWHSGSYPMPGGGQGNMPPGLTIPVPDGAAGYQVQLGLPQSLDIGASVTFLDSAGEVIA